MVKSFIEGENGTVVLFGPSESGKTHTLKGKTGVERGILPRAVEDIFNIVRNSEDRDEEEEIELESDSEANIEQYSSRRGTQDRVPERMFLRVHVY